MIDISSFGSSTAAKYFISLQADSGPNADLWNMYMYDTQYIQPELYRKVRPLAPMSSSLSSRQFSFHSPTDSLCPVYLLPPSHRSS